MLVYKKYLIKENDQFNPDDFPLLTDDPDTISIACASVPSTCNTEMMFSFLNGHTITSDCVDANPGLASMISSGSLPLKKLEDFFDSGSHNLLFRNQLEDSIRSRMTETVHP